MCEADAEDWCPSSTDCVSYLLESPLAFHSFHTGHRIPACPVLASCQELEWLLGESIVTFNEALVNSQIAHNISRRSHCSQMWTEEWELGGLRGGGAGRRGAGQEGGEPGVLLPAYSLLMPAGQVLLMPRPGIGRPWFPYTSRRFPDTGSCRVRNHIDQDVQGSRLKEQTDWIVSILLLFSL